jgi:hypothetical protein
MEFTRPGEPAFGQGIHSVPGDAMRLAAPDQGPSPEPAHPFAKDPEAVQVPVKTSCTRGMNDLQASWMRRFSIRFWP